MTITTAKALGLPSLPEDVITEILSREPAFELEDDREICEKMLSDLSEEDAVVAAETSFTYWIAFVTSPDLATPAAKQRMALKEMLRHYVGEQRNYTKAVTSLRGCLDYRKEYKTNVMRAAFMEDFPFESKEDTELAQHYRRLIFEELPKQVLVVRGHDKEGHPVYNLMNRTAPKETTNEEGFVVTRLYVMERALAVTEVRSRGRLEKITAIMAYSQLQRGNSPPTDALKKLVVILQNSYTERLRRLIVLAPPTWARVVYNLIYPFLRRETTQKFIMASGKKQIFNALSDVIGMDQTSQSLHPDGQLASPSDVHYFVNSVPFHCLYDEPTAAKTNTTSPS